MAGFFILAEHLKTLVTYNIRNTGYNILIGIITVFALFVSACKKEKLHWQQAEKLESHCTDRLNTIRFINDTLGYVAGGQRFDKSTILVTRDGGNTWSLQNLPGVTKGIYGLAQKYTGETYAVAFDGKLAWTGDEGQNWQSLQMNSFQPYKDIAFIEPSTGIIVGGISFNYGVMAYINDQHEIYRFDTFNYELNDIEMANNRTGYVSGFGVMMKTSDGAVTWKIQDVKNDNFTAIHMHSEQELWICGYNGSIFHTTDGGDNWERLRNGNDIKKPRYHLLDIVFKDRQNGWAVGEEGAVIHTTDGGHTWELYEKFTSAALRSIAIAPHGSLIVAGDEGTLYKLPAD
jgi:photosystem II stability/assembly factor-like uncharacterized protein